MTRLICNFIFFLAAVLVAGLSTVVYCDANRGICLRNGFFYNLTEHDLTLSMPQHSCMYIDNVNILFIRGESNSTICSSQFLSVSGTVNEFCDN